MTFILIIRSEHTCFYKRNKLSWWRPKIPIWSKLMRRLSRDAAFADVHLLLKNFNSKETRYIQRNIRHNDGRERKGNIKASTRKKGLLKLIGLKLRRSIQVSHYLETELRCRFRCQFIVRDEMTFEFGAHLVILSIIIDLWMEKYSAGLNCEVGDSLLILFNSNLKTYYLNLYLMHLPKPRPHSFPIKRDDIVPLDLKSLWKAMKECQKMGLTKAIEICNFRTRKLEKLLELAIRYFLLLTINEYKFIVTGIGQDEPSMPAEQIKKVLCEEGNMYNCILCWAAK